jgi:ribosomal protein L31
MYSIVSQMMMLVNRMIEIAYRSTEKKTLTCNAIIKFKLGNSVRIYIDINFLSHEIFIRQLNNVAAGGKIKTKVILLSI